jgi:hypothetical protein
MNAAKVGAATLMWCIVSGLLLVVAASCSLEQKIEPTHVEHGHGEQSGAEPAVQDYYARKTESFVANPFCMACHADFEEDELALDHKLAGIGCERCHGESERHRSDEANITPPELMYPKARINPTCMMCHPRHEIEHVQHHAAILAGAETIFDEKADESASSSPQYCMDCHGRGHRMNVRIVRWDKATGEIIETN